MHSSKEVQRIPVNVNTLTFTSSSVSREFYSCIYNDDGGRSISKEFKQNLLIYYAFFTWVLLTNLAVNVTLYLNGVTAPFEFVLQAGGPVMLLLLGVTLLCQIVTNERSRLQGHSLVTTLSILACFYLTISDRRVTSEIYGSEFDEEYVDSSLSVGGLVLANNFALFSNFSVSLLHVICTLFFRASLMFAFSQKSLNATSYDFLVLVGFCVMVLFIAHGMDFRTKQLFWRFHKEKLSLPEFPDLELDNYGATDDFEQLIQQLDEVKTGVKKTAQVIIYKDVRNELKRLTEKIEGVKRSIFKFLTKDGVSPPNSKDLDFESREFIQDHFGTCQVLRRFTTSREPSVIFNKPDPLHRIDIDEIESMLFSVGRNWNFDIWPVHNTTNHSVALLGKYLSYKWEFSGASNCKDRDFEDFFLRLENGYLSNPYHNACHAADVMSSVLYFIMCSTKLKEAIDVLDMIAVTIATLGHDVGHRGFNNRFLVNTKDSLAIRYNDNSVLENMHTATIFETMSQGFNVLSNLEESNWTRVRKCIIDMVLATDLAKHFEILTVFKARVYNLADINIELLEDRLLVLKVALKCGDIGHSAKSLYLHEKWTLLVTEEFFIQGDMEKQRGLPVSMFCDRETTNLPKAQAGFIKNICSPLFQSLGAYLNSECFTTNVLKSLNSNLEHWETLDNSKRRQSVLPSLMMSDQLESLRKSVNRRELDVGMKSGQSRF